MTKPNLGKQRTVRGAYSPDFKESKVTGLDRDSYNPGPRPNKYTSSTKGRPNEPTQSNGGFAGPVK